MWREGNVGERVGKLVRVFQEQAGDMHAGGLRGRLRPACNFEREAIGAGCGGHADQSRAGRSGETGRQIGPDGHPRWQRPAG